MRQRRLLAYGTLVVTLSTLLVGSGPAAAAPSAPPAVAPAAKPESIRSVTLFTGDRVSVKGAQISVTPRAGVHFIRLRERASDLLIPSDAIPLLKADRLDRRLFDVTALLEFEFDELAYLPLVVSDATGVRGLATGPKLDAIDGFATKVPISELAKTWQTTRTSLTSGKIWLDGVRKSALDVSVPKIGAPVAWAAGLDGTGVTVGVIDSGIDDSHPDLAGKVVARRNFVPDREDAVDLNGHGTHVSSILAGSGAASGGRYKGVAPGVKLLDGKACWNVEGLGRCSDSGIIAAMQWAVDSGAKVVNMSLGDVDTPGVDAMEQAVNDLTAQYGTLFVVAAGNAGGFAPYRVSSPSTADAALSVANWTKDDQPHWTSLPGPRLEDYAVKPDIAAPGIDISAARAPGALGHLPAGDYVALGGTSMASPHVAGAAALLAQAHPDWKAGQIKETLMASATANTAYSVFQQGAGYVNVAKALSQQVTVTPATLNVGALKWPHTELPATRTVTYHNRGDKPVSVDLALAGDTPAGMLALSTTKLTLPAGGDASVEVTVDERVEGPYGVHSGHLTATGEGVSLHTPFSVFHEPPAADLTTTVLGRGGAAPTEVVVRLTDLVSGAQYDYFEPSRTLRMPLDSTWDVSAYVKNGDGTIAFFNHSKVVLNKDREVLLDMRQTRPLKITPPDGRASGHNAIVSLARLADQYWWEFRVEGKPDTIYTADLGPANQPGLSTQVHAVFEGPPRRNQAPDVYQLGWHIAERFTTGFHRRLEERDLAAVDTVYAQNATGLKSHRWNTAIVPDERHRVSIELPPVDRPSRRTEYFTPGLPWRSYIVEVNPVTTGYVQSLEYVDARAYRAGNRYQEWWNGAVLTTTLVPVVPELPLVARTGDLLQVQLSQVTDGAGHAGFLYSSKTDRLALYRGDEVLGVSDYFNADFPLGADPAQYRLSYAYELPEPYRLSRRVETDWTFTTSAAEQGPLPLTTIGFAPELAPDNTTRAGSRLTIPLSFAQQASAGRVTSVRTWVSYDDGGTWTEAPTGKKKGKYEVTLHHPRQAGFVSLRALAVDDAGNAVATTIHRAYELR